MTAEDAPPRSHAHSINAWAVALFAAALVSFGAWLHTVRELNRLAAYRAVGAEALRLTQSARHEKMPLPSIYAGKLE